MKRRWLFWILIIAFLWVVISRFADIEKLVKTLEGGQWQWVAVAGLLQILYYIVYTWLYQSAFDTVEVRSRIGESSSMWLHRRRELAAQLCLWTMPAIEASPRAGRPLGLCSPWLPILWRFYLSWPLRLST